MAAMAVEEDKTEGKQAEDKGVFFWFGDDGAVHPNAQAVILGIVGPTSQHSVAGAVAGVGVLRGKRGQVKVANGLGHGRRPNPVDIGLPRAVVQVAAAHSRPDVVPTGAGDIVEKHIGDGAAAAAGEGEGGDVSSGGGDGDVVEGVGGA